MMDLHKQIMNICTTREAENAEYVNRREAYMEGHRDARHAAAELAAMSDARWSEKLEAAVAAERERCAKLADSYATWGGGNFVAAAIRA